VTLGGARIGLLEARLSSELAALVRREGGEPVCAPAVTEARVDVTAVLPALIEDLRSRRIGLVVCLTGAGVTGVLAQAAEIGLREPLVDTLREITTVCRGPKPAAALRANGIPVQVNVRAPYTAAELLEVLPDTLVRDQGIALVHDGGGDVALAQELRARGARLAELRSYEWRIPDDRAPMEALVGELIEGRIDAVAFTSQVQVRHLFGVAGDSSRSAALRYALRHRTVTASIGPTCSRALEELGAPPHVVASPPKMRPLVTAIAEHLAERRRRTGITSIP
jgi:uroporphyrinogen-III synthase